MRGRLSVALGTMRGRLSVALEICGEIISKWIDEIYSFNLNIKDE